MNNRKIVIAGGTGFIGRNLADWFGSDNEIVILTRNTKETGNNAFEAFTLDKTGNKNIRLVQWNGQDLGDWAKEIDGSDLVVNLTGKSVNCRYTSKNKKEILDSRIQATTVIGLAIQQATKPPKLWINAGSATIYRNATDRPQDEFTGEMHNDFSVQVCKLWEKTFFDQRTPFTRKIALRMAITLGAGGVMVPYFNLLKFGLGGQQASGKQMYSWVHIDDVCRAVDFMYGHADFEGVYNLAAPYAVTNANFMATLRKATGVKIGLPAFTWMLKIGAFLIGTEPELILKSRWVIPTKLLGDGFTFSFPHLDDAFTNILQKVPRSRYRLF